mmetsp:Transcript_65713/g.186533  ORF Transcript_65713/g.186533 Transcript_65713/m.186533 type:complete len:589 (-) Transcript_65713:164-1930(-)
MTVVYKAFEWLRALLPGVNFNRLFLAIRRHFNVFFVLFFSMGIKSLVNQVEQPFARSLVVCEVPVEFDSYTGSRWCGDRLRVIQEGMYLSAVGQGQEHFAMLCSLTFVIVVTGIWGPRVSLQLGLTGVTASVLLFVVACQSPAMGRRLFAVGQGLQGLYPIEYLLGVLVLYTARLPGADGEAVFQVLGYMGLISNLVWNVGLGSLVQLLELTDYKFVWSMIIGLDGLILAIVFFAFPEMKPMDSEKHEGNGVFMKVFNEVRSYGSLIWDWRARRYLGHKVAENLVYPWENTMTGGIYMAWFGWSQPAASLFFMWPQIINLFTQAYYSVLEKRFGNYRTFVWNVHYAFIARAVCGLLLALTNVPHAIFVYSCTLLSGFHAKRGFVDSRFVDEKQMDKFQSAQWVLGYFMGMWVGPLYASTFNPHAYNISDRLQMILPYVLVLFLNYVALFYGIWNMSNGTEGCGVTLKMLDEGGSKAVELWHLVSVPDNFVTREKWEAFQLGHIFGKDWTEVPGTNEFGVIASFEHFGFFLHMMNSSTQQGLETLQKLDFAILKARELHRLYQEMMQGQSKEHEAVTSEDPAPEGKKKA